MMLVTFWDSGVGFDILNALNPCAEIYVQARNLYRSSNSNNKVEDGDTQMKTIATNTALCVPQT